MKFEEIQARALRKKYLDQEKKGPNVNKEIGTLKRRIPLMLEKVDEKLCNFLQIVRRKGGVVNSVAKLKYAPVSNQTVAQKGSKHVAIKGSTYKNA